MMLGTHSSGAGGGRGAWLGVLKKNLCARHWHDEKSLNNFPSHNFPIAVYLSYLAAGRTRRNNFSWNLENLNISGARGARFIAAVVRPAVSLSVSVFLSASVLELGIRYYELLWESVGISRGCLWPRMGEQGAAHVCLQFHALRFSRSTFHAAPQEKWESVSVWGKSFVIVYVFWQAAPRARLARQFGAGDTLNTLSTLTFPLSLPLSVSLPIFLSASLRNSRLGTRNCSFELTIELGNCVMGQVCSTICQHLTFNDQMLNYNIQLKSRQVLALIFDYI